MRISESRIRRIIREEMVRETKHRFPAGNMMLRGRPADINFDYGMRNRLDPDYNAEDDMSQWATIPAAPGSPSDTMGYRDQENDVLKLSPKVVASKIIDAWGAKDTLGMLEILKADAGNDEDYHDAMVWMYAALKTAVDIDMDPAGRDHTPSEKKWIESVIGETYRQASNRVGARGFDPRRSMGRHFGPPVKGMNESRIRRIIQEEARRALREGVGEGIDREELAEAVRDYHQAWSVPGGFNGKGINPRRARGLLDGVMSKDPTALGQDFIDSVGLTSDAFLAASGMGPGTGTRPSAGSYINLLAREMRRVGREDVAEALAARFVPGRMNFEELNSLESALYLMLMFYFDGAQYFYKAGKWRTPHVRHFVSRMQDLERDPDALRYYRELRESVPKFVRFFKDREFEDYEEGVIRMIDPTSLSSILQAAELVDSLAM